MTAKQTSIPALALSALILLLTSLSLSAQEADHQFEQTISVTGAANTPENELVFGMNPNASDGLDHDEETIVPPPPPYSNNSIYFENSEINSAVLQDVRSSVDQEGNTKEEVIWTIRAIVASDAQEEADYIKLDWTGVDLTGLNNPDASLRLKGAYIDADQNPQTISEDLTKDGSVVLSKSVDLTIVLGNPDYTPMGSLTVIAKTSDQDGTGGVPVEWKLLNDDADKTEVVVDGENKSQWKSAMDSGKLSEIPEGDYLIRVTPLDAAYETPGDTPVTINAGETRTVEITYDLIPAEATVAPEAIGLLEGGRDGQFEVVLGTEPTADVTVTASQAAETTIDGLTIQPETLTFTASNWDSPQLVRVFPPDTVGQNTDASIDFAFASNDARYDDHTAITSAVSIVDRGDAEVRVAPRFVEMQEGGTAELTVELSKTPSADITVSFASSFPNIVDIQGDAEITFTPQDASLVQTVTLNAPVDNDFSDSVPVLIDVTANGEPLPDVEVIVFDTSEPNYELDVDKGHITLVEDGASKDITVTAGAGAVIDLELLASPALRQAGKVIPTEIPVEFGAGQSKQVFTFSIPANSIEASETAHLFVHDMVTGQAESVVIEAVDSEDAAPELPFLIANPLDITVTEGETVDIGLTLSDAAAAATLSATPSQDGMVTVSGTEIADGQGTLSITAQEDDEDTDPEELTITLTSDDIANDVVLNVFIEDNDVEDYWIEIAPPALVLNEGASKTIEIWMEGNINSEKIIDLTESGDITVTGDDLTNNQLTFTDVGPENAQTITVTADDNDEVDEPAMSGGIRVVAPNRDKHLIQVDINDDDDVNAPLALVPSARAIRIDEGTGTQTTVDVNLNGVPDSAINVTVSLAGDNKLSVAPQTLTLTDTTTKTLTITCSGPDGVDENTVSALVLTSDDLTENTMILVNKIDSNTVEETEDDATDYIRVRPRRLRYGTVDTGESRTMKIGVRNTTDAGRSVRLVNGGDNPDLFTHDYAASPLFVPARTVKFVEVTYTPDAAAAHSASLAVVWGDGNSKSIPLSGTGRDPQQADNPAMLYISNFPAARLGKGTLQDVAVDISLDDPADANDYQSLKFTLSYDPQIMSVMGVDTGNLSRVTGVVDMNVDSKNGTATVKYFGFDENPAITAGTGKIAEITLRVAASRETMGAYPLLLTADSYERTTTTRAAADPQTLDVGNMTLTIEELLATLDVDNDQQFTSDDVLYMLRYQTFAVRFGMAREDVIADGVIVPLTKAADLTTASSAEVYDACEEAAAVADADEDGQLTTDDILYILRYQTFAVRFNMAQEDVVAEGVLIPTTKQGSLAVDSQTVYSNVEALDPTQ